MATKTINSFTASDGMADADELLVWDVSSGETRKAARSALYRLPTAEEAGDAALTDVTAWNALRVGQVADARIAAANDTLRAFKTIKEERVSNGTVADDADLQVLLAAGAIYHIQGEFVFTSKSGVGGGFRWNVSYPACDSLCLKSDVIIAPSAQAGVPNYAVTAHYLNIIERGGGTTALAADEGDITAGTGVVSVLKIRGQIDGGVAGGLFKFRWAQWLSSLDPTALWPGSELKFILQS